jgi:hypothetical protein
MSKATNVRASAESCASLAIAVARKLAIAIELGFHDIAIDRDRKKLGPRAIYTRDNIAIRDSVLMSMVDRMPEGWI